MKKFDGERLMECYLDACLCTNSVFSFKILSGMDEEYWNSRTLQERIIQILIDFLARPDPTVYR